MPKLHHLQIPVVKNQCITVPIVDITSEGNGVAKMDQFTVFVPSTAVGDLAQIKIVKVLKHYAFGILQKLITPSPDRVEADCPVYKQCGGCSYRHISYSAELRVKQQQVAEIFQRIGGIPLLPQPICGSPQISAYRNKAQYPIGMDEHGNAVAGFYAKRSHRIIPCQCCDLQPKIFTDILEKTLEFVNQNQIAPYQEERHRGILRHLYLRLAESTGEIMLCLVTTTKTFPSEDRFCSWITRKFPQISSIVLNYNPEKTNVILGKECRILWGKEVITDNLCGVQIEISPLSFYQVNKQQAEQLYQQAIAYAQLSSDDILLDLYCGTGTIGLSAAKQVKLLLGVEIIPQAIENAKRNAKCNQFEHTRFLCADCKSAVLQLEQEQLQPDVIIVDPPRKGCAPEVIESISRLSPERLVMISCNPATAARDCKLLTELGYQVTAYRPFDLFPRTNAIECVVQLQKTKSSNNFSVP